MSWTTIWSHAQRGIARYSSSKGTVQLTMRRIDSVEKISLVFANEYGNRSKVVFHTMMPIFFLKLERLIFALD